MDQNQSITNDLSSIESQIKSLVANKNNARLSLLDLSKLTQYLRKQKPKAKVNALGMLKKNIIDLFNEILQNQIIIHNEESAAISFGISKLLYFILVSINEGNGNENGHEYNEGMASFVKTSHGLILIMNFIKEILSSDNSNTLFIFLNMYQFILQWVNTNHQNEFEGYLTFLFSLFESNEISTQTINLIVSNVQALLIEYSKIDGIALENMSYFLTNLSLITSTFKDEETIVRSLDIMDTICKNISNHKHFKDIDLFKLISNIRINPINYNSKIALYFRIVLSQLINRNDLEAVMNMLSHGYNCNVINSEGKDYLMLKYIKQTSTSTIDYIILMEYLAKIKKFASELNKMNAIKVFYGLFIEEIKKLTEKKEEIAYEPVSRILFIITSLTSDYDFFLTESNGRILNQTCKEAFKIISACPSLSDTLAFSLIDFLLSQPATVFNTSISLIETSSIENTMLCLLRNYYNKQWALDCINRISLSVIYKDKYKTVDDFYKEKSHQILNVLSNDPNTISNSIQDNIDLILIQLIKKQKFDEVIDQTIANDLFTIINKVIQILYSDKECKEDIDNAGYPNESQSILTICFIFCLIEVRIANEETYNNINRSEPLFKVVNSLITNQTLSFKIFDYISIQMIYLSSESKLKQRFDALLFNEYSCAYIYHSLTIIIDKDTEKGTQQLCTFLNNILQLLRLLIQSPDQFDKFLSLEGIDLLFKLVSHQFLFDSKHTQVLTAIFNYISKQYLNSVTMFYDEEWLLESLISHVTNIKISLGVNNPLSYQVLFLLKEILANGNKINTLVIEESNLIVYLVKELIALYPYYSNLEDNCFIIVLSILFNISENKEVAHLFLDLSLIDTILATLNEMNSNESMFNSESFIQMTMLCLSIIKENCLTSLIYSNKAIRKCIQLTQTITLARHKLINDTKIIEAYDAFAEVERKNHFKNQLISQSFLNELKTKMPEIKLIKDKSLQDSIIKKFNGITEEKSGVFQPTNNQETTTTNTTIASTENIKITYEQAISSFYELIESIDDGLFDRENQSNEDAKLYSLIVVIRSFASSPEKVESMCKEGIIDKIIILIENEHLFTIEQEMVYHLLNELINCQCTIQLILSSETIPHFFLKEFHKLSQTCSENISFHLKPKMQVITKLMSKLTENSFFVKNSYNYFTNDTIRSLSIISVDNDIIINLLITLNHLLSFSDDYSSYLNTVSHIISTVIWKKYSQAIDVMIEIMNVIELLHKNEAFIEGILKENIVSSLLEILLKGNKDNFNEGFIRVFTLMNLLSYHYPFTNAFITKGKEILIDSSVKNISEPSLIINVLKFMNTSIDQNAKVISLLTLTTINDFLVKALTQFMKTNNIDIINNVLTLILKLLLEEKNKRYYVDGARLNLLLQISSIHKTNASIVSMAYDFFHIILEPKLQYQNQGVMDSSEEKKKISNKFNANLDSLESNLNEVHAIFFDNIDLLTKFLNVIKRICKLDINIEIKRRFLSIVIENFSASFFKEKINQSELFLDFILQISEIDKGILLSESSHCLHLLNQLIKSISIDYISDSLSKAMLQLCIIILKLETKSDITFIPSVVSILLWIKDNHQLHISNNILQMSIIVKTLCSFDVNFFIDNKNGSCCLFYFILNYLMKNINPVLEVSGKVIENCKKISLYYQIQSDDNGREIAEILYHFYQTNYNEKNVPILINTLQIVSNLCRCSSIFKKELNTTERNLPKDLEELINQSCFNDKLLTYQAKGALMLLNVNVVVLEKNIANIFNEDEDDFEIKGDMKKFLTEKKKVKLYTDEGCFDYVILQMDEKMDKIMASNLPNNELKEIYIKDMDSCVRSCSSNLFKTKLFAKKPKGAHCFSIIIMKNIKYVKNLNVECEDEEACVKYVDYISMIINKQKTKRSEFDV